MELILICARIRRPIFLLRKLFKYWPKQMSSLKVLSWHSLKKLSPFAVERDSSDLVLKPSEDSCSFHVTLSQLEKLFKYLTKFSYNFLEPLIFKCNLRLLRFLLVSIALWLMNGIFTSLHKFDFSMYLYVIRMSLVCTRMLSVCHSYVLVCHPYVTRMCSYVYLVVCHPYVTHMNP